MPSYIPTALSAFKNSNHFLNQIAQKVAVVATCFHAEQKCNCVLKLILWKYCQQNHVIIYWQFWNVNIFYTEISTNSNIRRKSYQKLESLAISRHPLDHGLRTPNEGINQKYLKNWADVAAKYASVKSVFSKKATKFDKIFTFDLTVTT